MVETRLFRKHLQRASKRLRRFRVALEVEENRTGIGVEIKQLRPSPKRRIGCKSSGRNELHLAAIDLQAIDQRRVFGTVADKHRSFLIQVNRLPCLAGAELLHLRALQSPMAG